MGKPNEKNRPYFSWNTGCLIGILIFIKISRNGVGFPKQYQGFFIAHVFLRAVPDLDMPWDKCKNKMICSGSTPAPLCQWKIKMNQRRRHHNYDWTNRFLPVFVGEGYCIPQWMMYVLAWYHVEHTVHIDVLLCLFSYGGMACRDAGLLDSKLSIAPAYWLKTPKTEPTKTTHIANKTAPLASRCFYPVISILISLCFCLFDWNQVESLYF